MNKTIKYVVAENGDVLCDGSRRPQPAGVQGDHNCCTLEFDLNKIHKDGAIYFFEFVCGAGTPVIITPDSEGVVFDEENKKASVLLGDNITGEGGQVEVRVVQEVLTEDFNTTTESNTYVCFIKFENKQSGLWKIKQSVFGIWAEVKARLEEALSAATQASESYTQAVEAIEGKENEVVGGNAITVDRETAEGKTIIGVDNSQVIGRDEFNHSIKPAIYEDIEKKADEEYVESIPSMIVETRFNQPEGNPIQFETSSDGTSHLTLDVDYELSADSDNAVANYVLKENLENKQDKEDGKGLSTNDYTTADKNKLASVESGANKTVVDDEISEGSENPVQNKVLASILCDKTDKEYVDNYAEKKMGTSTVLNNPLTANCNYFFTVDDNFILSFPTEDLTQGDTIYLNFECSTDVTLIVDTSNTTAIDIIPEANKGYEVFGCWNGDKWVLGYDEYDLPVTTIE